MAAISGVIRSPTKAVTTAPKARPMTTATARSTRFPRRRNALKSFTPGTLEALRIHVHDRAEARAAHGRRGSREKRGRAGGERARMLCLAHELRPMAAAQPQERRRPEQLVTGQARLQLLE